jgi:phenylalanyl-tRNA synthetase beta chain
MKILLSWLRDFVDITLPIEEVARMLTMAGLEVEQVRVVGLPMPKKVEGHTGSRALSEISLSWLEWDPEKIVTAAVSEVMPHPNADRLVLCKLFDGQVEHIVLTGAPNLYPYKGMGTLPRPLKVPYAKEGAQIYDGHQPGQVLTTLKRARIRGIESYSMICSEKELGISDDHEGVIILDDDAPVGAPLCDYMGDAVLEISILPNVARALSVLGVARELAALTGQPLKTPPPAQPWSQAAPSIEGMVHLDITNSELNPRFVLGLIKDIHIKPSPYQVQRRLRLAGMRPINNIVDATNYAMLELGEPLHAFDYDTLVQRAGGKAPTIITRTARPAERLTTLDGVEHFLDEFNELVCDSAGALSIAGIMGGAESEVNPHTRNVLLEGAAWNYINVRKTMATQKMTSEAGYRFSRGVHPALAELGVRRGLELMAQWGGGQVYQGLVDHYLNKPADPQVEVSPADVQRWLGVSLTAAEIANLLARLEFSVEIHGETVRAITPPHRLDISDDPVSARADLMEEIARVVGYECIPETRLADELPPQRSNPGLEKEERARDILVGLELQEVISHRLTTPEREARRLLPASPADDRPYVRLLNPIASDRVVMRHSLLASVLEVAERNARLQPRLALFEIGPVFLDSEDSPLPEENNRLVIALCGPRSLPGWQAADAAPMDFYDLKGIVATLLDELHITEVGYVPTEHPSLHPGKSARLLLGEQPVGVLGELHPLVRERYDLPAAPLLAADLHLDAILAAIPALYTVQAVPEYPPILEDLAVVVDEALPAERVVELIRQAGGKTIMGVRLFDVYRGDQAGPGKKSLAFGLTYQAADRTLTDQEAAQVRQRIIRCLEQELGAKLRS